MNDAPDLHEFLDVGYGADGDQRLLERLKAGEDPNARRDPRGETPLHVAARRRRKRAIEVLLDHGADIDAKTTGGKTAYVHSARRTFRDITALLESRGANLELGEADRFAIAVAEGRLEEASKILAVDPRLARTGNPEEDRLLADMAGRNEKEPIELLINAGADLCTPGLDEGTPLHIAAWFGQPENARLLIEAGAPLNIFESFHGSSPIGWVTHGSRYSGGASDRQALYVEIAELFLRNGCSLRYPGDLSNAYLQHLHADAIPAIATLLPSI